MPTRFVFALATVATLVMAEAAYAQRPDAAAVKELKSDPKQFIEVLQGYFAMVDQESKLANDPRSVLIIAQHDIKDLYLAKNGAEDAVKELKKMLGEIKDPAARTTFHFTLVDLYKQLGRPQDALEELRAIVSENTRRLAQEGEAPPRKSPPEAAHP